MCLPYSWMWWVPLVCQVVGQLVSEHTATQLPGQTGINKAVFLLSSFILIESLDSFLDPLSDINLTLDAHTQIHSLGDVICGRHVLPLTPESNKVLLYGPACHKQERHLQQSWGFHLEGDAHGSWDVDAEEQQRLRFWRELLIRVERKEAVLVTCWGVRWYAGRGVHGRTEVTHINL